MNRGTLAMKDAGQKGNAKSNVVRNLVELNFAILFISTSGALGKYIDLPVPAIIALRSAIAGILLFAFCRYKGFDLRIQKRDRWRFLVMGLLMGLHWLTFFYALKLSNVAIGMLSLYTYPVLTTLLEPLILKTPFQKVHILLAGLVLLGVYFLMPAFDLQNNYFLAILIGISSAIFYAFRNLIAKPLISSYNGSILMVYQLLVIAFFLSPSVFYMNGEAFMDQLPWVLLLSLLTTAIGHTWFLYSLKNFTVTSASIISSAQPIYGTLIGVFFLSDVPDLKTIIGGALILSSVVMEVILLRKKAA